MLFSAFRRTAAQGKQEFVCDWLDGLGWMRGRQAGVCVCEHDVWYARVCPSMHASFAAGRLPGQARRAQRSAAQRSAAQRVRVQAAGMDAL